MMSYKLSLIMVCWTLTCKDVFVNSVENQREGSPPYFQDETKQNYDWDVVTDDEPNQEPQEPMNDEPVFAKQQFRKDEDEGLVVETKLGKTRGVVLTAATGKKVIAWYGIPYAQKPVGNLRFRKPVPADRWDKDDTNFVFNATDYPNTCFQMIDTMFGDFAGATMWNPNSPLSEDCLYLNIISPYPRPKNATVMVWIFGGGFYSGTSTLDVYDPKTLASEEKVIIASMQYRVTSLGFLYFGTEDAPGNVGLFDQQLGLQWIQDNIEGFGGNRHTVTLFGESAGAVSVSMHLLSPSSRNLFSKAIMESGSPTAPWAVLSRAESIRRGLQLAKVLGCPHSIKNLAKVTECLRKVNATTLVAKEWVVEGVCDFPFVPVIDGDFLPCDPEECAATSNFKNVSIIMGSNTEEGFYFIMYFLTDLMRREENILISRDQFVRAANSLNPDLNDIARQAIVFEYTDWTDPDDGVKNRDALDKLVGDRQFTCNVNEFAHAYARAGNDVYMYFFKHRSSRSLWPTWSGVLHGDEINFIFGEPLDPIKQYRFEEIQLSKRMMRYWANFAKTGNPSQNEDGSWTSIYWPLHTADGREYLTLDVNDSVTGKGPRIRPCVFWKQYIPQLLEGADNITKSCRNTANVSYVRGLGPVHFVALYTIVKYTTGWIICV